jgi:hypothetical protein
MLEDVVSGGKNKESLKTTDALGYMNMNKEE